jgi:hypothetical protein
MCALFKAYKGGRAWKAIGDSLQAPSYLSRVDRNWNIRARKQRTDLGKYSFVNGTITDRNQLSEGKIAALTGNTYSFRKRVTKVITSATKCRG